jgi:ribosomal protein S18 acetylase RimI-like enzyme
MNFELVDIAPHEIELLRAATIELHHHEAAVSPALGHAAARSDQDYWRLYSARFAGLFRAGDGFCVAARGDDGAILGFVFAVEKQGDAAYDTGDRVGYVEEIVVVQSARLSGVGLALMSEARKRFAARGLTAYKLSTVPGNDAARNFYSRLGLQPAAQLLIGEV